MYIVWGTSTRKNFLGTVADHCPLCDGTQTFSVYDLFAYSHVYFIPLSGGQKTGTSRQCAVCQTWVGCQTNSYDTLLTTRMARGLSVAEVLEQTNTRLLQRHQNEQLWSDYRRRPLDSDDDTLARLALARMRENGLNDATMSHYQDRLIGWHRLTPEARSRLLQEIDTAIVKQQAWDQASGFVSAAAQSAPEDGVGCVPLFGVGIGLIVLVCFVFPLVNHPRFEHNWLIILGFFSFLGAVLLAAYLRFHRAAYERFFRERMIRPAETAQIDLALLCEVAESIRHWGSLSAELCKVLNYHPILHEQVRERLPQHEQGSHFLTNGRLPLKRWVTPLIVVSLAVCVVTLIVNNGVKQQTAKEDEAQWSATVLGPFEQRMKDFVDFDPGRMPREVDVPHVKGRVIPIDVSGDKRVADIYLGLPLDLRAERPEQVGTIAWLAFGGLTVGQYQPGVDAIVQTCHVTLIDKERGVVIAEQDFRGGEPPSHLYGTVNYGPKPEREVIEWLSSLPRR